MRSVMIVSTTKRSTARFRAPKVNSGWTYRHSSSTVPEAFDLAIGLGRVGSDDVVTNRQRVADLLKARSSRRVKRVAHRKGERVIREDGVDPVWQRADDMLKKIGCGGVCWSGRFRCGRPPHELKSSTAANSKSWRALRSAEQIFEIEMNELARMCFFVSFPVRPRGTRQPIQAVSLQDALDGAVPHVQDVCNPRRSVAAPATRVSGAEPPTDDRLGD